MDFFEVLNKRRSTRQFQERPLEEEKLQKILEAANAAPSAGNLQPYEILVVKDHQTKQALCQAALNQESIKQAPVVLVFCQNVARSESTYGARGRELYVIQDMAIACAYAQLAATAVGCASCWIGAFYPDQVQAVLKAPSGLIPAAFLALGYPAEDPKPTGRRPLTDLVKWETF